jgi:hypothetical protein
MLLRWHEDLESFEAISQNAETRMICLRMAALAQNGEIGRFLSALQVDAEVDAATRGTLEELAGNPSFLLAVEDYVHRTQTLH